MVSRVGWLVALLLVLSPQLLVGQNAGADVRRIYAAHDNAAKRFFDQVEASGENSPAARAAAGRFVDEVKGFAAGMREIDLTRASNSDREFRDVVASSFDGEAALTRLYANGQTTFADWREGLALLSSRVDEQLAALSDADPPEASSDGWSLPSPLNEWWFWLLGPAELLLGLLLLPFAYLFGAIGAAKERWAERRSST